MDTLALPFSFKSIDDAGLIEGLASPFGNVDLGGDIVMPGAFTKTLADRAGAPVPMLFAHDLKRPIGVWSILRETSAGLEAKGRITLATRDGAEAHALARDGALGGLSIGYIPTRHARRGQDRELHEILLSEVSLVPVPMNERARVRSVKAITTIRDLEDLLHDGGGLSGRRAKIAAAAAWKAINDQSDEDTATATFAAIIEASAARIAAF